MDEKSLESGFFLVGALLALIGICFCEWYARRTYIRMIQRSEQERPQALEELRSPIGKCWAYEYCAKDMTMYSSFITVLIWAWVEFVLHVPFAPLIAAILIVDYIGIPWIRYGVELLCVSRKTKDDNDTDG